MISKAKRHISRSIPHCQSTVDSWLFQICRRYKRTGNFWESIKNENFGIKMQAIDSAIFTVIPSTSCYPAIVLLMDTAPALPPESARTWPSICLQITSMAFPHSILPYVNRGPVTPFTGFAMNSQDSKLLLMVCPPSTLPFPSLHFVPSSILFVCLFLS